MKENINLCKILKDCPRGTRFWSPMLGNVEFLCIIEPKILVNTIEGSWEINSDSTITIDCFTSVEPMLFPSKDQRDWSKFTAPWYNKEESIKPKFKVGDMIRHKETNRDNIYKIRRVYDNLYVIDGFSGGIYIKNQDQYELISNKFDPKTLKAFDKVLVRSEKVFNWNCSLFSNIDDFDSKYPFTCLGLCYKFCIPYNDDTKHLIGTTDEAPEFYRYWEN